MQFSNRTLLLKNIPNAITMLRILLLAPLGFLAVGNKSQAFALLLIFFWLTDFLDGFLARMLKVSSSFGAELDSIADSLGGVMITFYLMVLFPQIFTKIMPYLIFAGILGVSYIGLALYRIRRIGLHFLSAKLLGFATFVFQVQTALVGFNQVIFWIWLTTFTLAMSEQMLALLLGKPSYQTRNVFEVLDLNR